MNDNTRDRDKDIESVLGSLLRIGVITSAAIVIIGGILYLFQYGYRHPHFHTFRGETLALRNVKLIFKGVFALHSLSIIQMGLLVLIATPVARIIFSVIGFIYERDFLYVFITLLVLMIIAFSLFSGIVV